MLVVGIGLNIKRRYEIRDILGLRLGHGSGVGIGLRNWIKELN